MTILAIIGAMALFINMIMILVLFIFIYIMQQNIRDSLTIQKVNHQNIHTIHMMLVNMLSGAGHQKTSEGDVHRTFKTEDGKYTSDSFDGLMRQIAKDSAHEIDPEDLERLEDSFDEDDDVDEMA